MEFCKINFSINILISNLMLNDLNVSVIDEMLLCLQCGRLHLIVCVPTIWVVCSTVDFLQEQSPILTKSMLTFSKGFVLRFGDVFAVNVIIKIIMKTV